MAWHSHEAQPELQNSSTVKELILAGLPKREALLRNSVRFAQPFHLV